MEREAPTGEPRKQTAGQVMWIPEDGSVPRRERVMIGLLALIAALLTVLVVGLGVGAWWTAREIDRLEAAMGARSGDLEQQLAGARATSAELIHELNERQSTLSTQLEAHNRALQAELNQLDRERLALGPVPDGPIEKADYALRLSQLTLRAMMINNRFWATTQGVAATGIAPLPAQQELVPPR